MVRSWVENENPDAAAAFDFEMLTAMGYHSLPQENTDQPLVFQVTRVSSVLLKVLRGVQWLAPPKTVWRHLTAQVMRIWRGSVADGNISIFPEADATRVDLLSGATWSALEHLLTKWTCTNASKREGCIDLSGPVPAMLDISALDQKCPVFIIA